MQMIEILAMPYDMLELRKGVAAFRPPVRRQVATNNAGTERLPCRTERRWTEVLPSNEIGCGIERLALVSVRVEPGKVLKTGRRQETITQVGLISGYLRYNPAHNAMA